MGELMEWDEFLRVAPAIAVLLFVIMPFVLSAVVRRYQVKITEQNLAANIEA
jgi:hypothetical protein